MVCASTVIRVLLVPEISAISSIFMAWTCMGAAPNEEMICTDTFGVALKTGNLNSPCKTLAEFDGPSWTDAEYVNAVKGVGLGSKYTAVVRVICPGPCTTPSLPRPPLDTCRCGFGASIRKTGSFAIA